MLYEVITGFSSIPPVPIIVQPWPGEGAILPAASPLRYNKESSQRESGSPGMQMTPVAGPLLSSFMMFYEIEALHNLVPLDFVLYLVLMGLLLTFFLDFRHR